MRYRLTDSAVSIFDADAGCFISQGTWLWDEYEQWLAAGNVPDPLPAPTFAEVVQALMPGVQAWMEGVVRANGYDSVISCASYANSGVEQWRNDALAVIAWRDAVWQAAYAWQAGANGQLPATIPTLAEVIAQLPQPEAFDWVAHDPGYSLPPE